MEKYVPELLKGLTLYEKDERLCEKFDKVMLSWKFAYPNVNFKSQIAWAHAWEISNPGKRKKDRIRFLNNWFKEECRREATTKTSPFKFPPPPVYDIKESDIVTPQMFSELKKSLRNKN